MEDHCKRHGRLARWIAVLALAAGAFPASAGAACPDQPTSTVFARWGDTADYFLAPGGDFEGAATSWTGGALMPGNEPFYLAGRDDVQSLRVAANRSASSPAFCVDASHPDFRFVARPLRPYDLSWLEIYVRFRHSDVMKTWLVGGVGQVRSWGMTPQIRLTRDLPIPADGTEAQVLFRAVGGTWVVDDVFIDPFRR